MTAKQMAVKQNQPRMPVLRSTAVGPPIKEMFDSAPSVVNLNMSMISEETHTHTNILETRCQTHPSVHVRHALRLAFAAILRATLVGGVASDET